MAIITVDYDQEEAAKAAAGGNGYQGYPDGKYVLQCQSYTQKPAKSAGKSPTLQTKWKIVNSFNGQNLEKPATIHLSLSPKSVPYNLVRVLQAMGVPFTMPQPGKIVFDPDHMHGGKVEATLKNKPGERSNLENWDNYAPVGGAAPQQQQVQQPQQMLQPQMPVQNFGPPTGGWAPPQQQMPQQMPNNAYPQQQPTYQQPQQQMAPQSYPQQQPQQPQQQVYGPPQGYPQQQPMQQPPVPQNGNGAPAWMQPGLAPNYPRGNG